MKKLICALIGAASLVASATTYIQTSTTGTAPWKPVKDSVSQAHLADSARKADSTRTAWKADSARIAWFAHAATYADSSRVSGLADSAKRAAWAPLDSVGVRGIVGDTATVLRSNMGDYIPLTGSGAIRGDLSPTASGQNIDLGSVGKEWTNVYATNGIFGGIETDLIYTKAVNLRGGNLFNGDSVSGWGFFGGAYRVYGGTQKGFLKADGSVDSSGAFAGVSDSSRASHIADTAKKSGTSGNSLALGGIAASQYGTLAQDTLIAKKVASDTATVLRAGIASAITTSEAYAIARISDSLTANTRAWTTLAAAKSSIHDSLTVERTFDTTASRSITHDTAAALRTYVGSASTTGNAATATKLATARTIGMSGDVTGTATAFDGTANITIPTTLPTLLTAGSAGSSTSVPTLTWDAKGRLIAAGSAAISIPHAQISDWGTYINQALLTTSSPTFGNANIGTMIGYPNISWFGYSGFNVGTNYSGFYQTNASDIGIAALSGHGVYLQVAQTQILDILGDGIIAHQPISANGGITGNLSGTASNASALGGVAASSYLLASTASSTYLPLSGGTMYGHLLGGTPYNIGASSNWWGSIYATAIYESNVALSSKYLGINNTASNASSLGGVGSDYFVRGGGLNYGARTTPLPNWSSGTSSSQQLMKTGAYDGNFPLSDMPTAGWWIINHVKHSDPSGAGNSAYWGFDLAAGMGTGGSTAGQYCVRTSTSNDWGAWHTLLHSDNYSSYAIPLTGSTAITGSFAPATNQYYDLGAPSYQWHNVMAKTFVENGTSLSGLYASLNNDNTLVGQNDFAGRTITDGNLLVRGTFSTGFSVWSTNTARTLDIANTNVHIYNVVTNTQQTLPNGLYNGQVIFFKNNTQSGIVPVGSINSSSMPIEPLSTVMLVWDANNTIWL